jgi:apolipoprotein D and lipocalin family protein
MVEAVGRAYFVDGPEIGRVKVSFFGPFYGGFNVMELDTDHYQAICSLSTTSRAILV